MAGILRVPRTRGAISGVLLVLLGIWGGLIAFVGPYAGYGYLPDQTWAYTTDRLYLVILPGAGAVLGGLLVLASANRATAMFGGWLAAVSGAWFVVGLPLSPIWRGTANPMGMPLGTGATHHALEHIGMFSGLGVVIVFLAALSLGRFAVRGLRESRAGTGTVAGDTGTSPAHTAGYAAGRGGAPESSGTPAGETGEAPAGEHGGAHPASREGEKPGR